jgi:serine/threonine-protein kinase
MADSLVGKKVGDYRLASIIGRGGMGVVYEAHDLALNRTVALKLLAPELLQDATARARFQREIRSAVAIEHPHVVPVYAAGYDEGFFFLAMRYVRGPDLWQIVHDHGPISEPRAMRLVGQIASALYDVHEHDLVHRDVKPQNVLVWHAGAIDEHTFLTDFGIARALGETGGITRFGVLGTRGYMAPEVVDGARATPASDQYSLACLLFELLSGNLPFELDDDGMIDLTVARPLPGVSTRIRAMIERALSEKPQDRFADCRAFVMIDGTAHEAFERSQAISETVAGGGTDTDLVEKLGTQGLSSDAIAAVADLDRSRVTLLQRRAAARRSLIGE